MYKSELKNLIQSVYSEDSRLQNTTIAELKRITALVVNTALDGNLLAHKDDCPTLDGEPFCAC